MEKTKPALPFAESGVDSRGRYSQIWNKGLCIRTQGKICDETQLKSEIIILTDAKESLGDVLFLATSAST